MSMGKGLDAILKAPGKLKRAESGAVATGGVNTAQVATDGVATMETSVAAERTNIAEEHIAEVADEEEKVNAKVTTNEVITTQVATGGGAIKREVIAKAISDAKRSPRISTWSPVAMGTLKVLWMTQPRFSMSNEIRALIEEGLAKKYPELVELVKKELEQR